MNENEKKIERIIERVKNDDWSHFFDCVDFDCKNCEMVGNCDQEVMEE